MYPYEKKKKKNIYIYIYIGCDLWKKQRGDAFENFFLSPYVECNSLSNLMLV